MEKLKAKCLSLPVPKVLEEEKDMMSSPDQKLLDEFEAEMWRLYEEPKKKLRYNVTYYLRMLRERGALETARYLAGNPEHHEGLTKLWEEGCLDLSVEALVLKERYKRLFSQEVLSAAEKKMKDLGYPFL